MLHATPIGFPKKEVSFATAIATCDACAFRVSVCGFNEAQAAGCEKFTREKANEHALSSEHRLAVRVVRVSERAEMCYEYQVGGDAAVTRSRPADVRPRAIPSRESSR